MRQPYSTHEDIFRRDDWNRPRSSDDITENADQPENWNLQRPTPTPPRGGRLPVWLLVGGALLLIAGGITMWVGLLTEDEPPRRVKSRDTTPPPPSQRKFAKDIIIETQGFTKRVVVRSIVCLTDGVLEGLLTARNKKEHEFILATEADAQKIHLALLAIGAEAGEPVRYEPTYRPARGTKIDIFVRYQQDGETVVRPAGDWIKYAGKDKTLEHPWVFAGSKLLESPFEPGRTFYAASTEGTYICVSNMDIAMLDLPIKSSKDTAELLFETYSKRIPPLNTPVEVLLELKQ